MAGKKLHISVLSPTGRLFAGDIAHAVFPGSNGSFAVYPMHAPLISSLTAGTIKCVKENGEEREIPVTGGFVEVADDRITVCAEQKKIEKNDLPQ